MAFDFDAIGAELGIVVEPLHKNWPQCIMVAV